jgi:colanic acid/amylovoran biosynthesis glycosyltransferase
MSVMGSSKPMRVAMILEDFPVVSQTFILDQITGLLERGDAVDVYAEWREETAVVHPEARALLARTRYVDMPAASGYWEWPVRPLLGRTWLPGAAEPISNLRRVAAAAPVFARCLVRAPRVTRAVVDRREYGGRAESLSALYRLGALAGARGRYDVVHAHFGPVADRFRFAGQALHAPLVVSFHGYDYTSWPREHGEDVYLPLWAAAAVVTVNSEYARARLQKLGCPPERIVQVPYGVDLDAFATAAREPRAGEPLRVLTVARLVEKKGVADVVRAVAGARARGVAVRYDVVGDGPLGPELARLARQLGVGGEVVWHGARDRRAVEQLMAGADVFALASVTAADGDEEGTPVALLEAQAGGIPVLATRHSGIPEIVADGESGFLVDEHDAEALAERLVLLATDPGARAEMGRAGRRRMEAHHDRRDVLAHLLAVYREAAERAGTTKRSAVERVMTRRHN